ncbi:hypothetical protein Taro_031119, partial [Colocasia esculenta]|nr:hypothetical protein [Colocasia esculenta]
MLGTSRDPGLELSRLRHWKRTSWGPVRLLVSVPPTTSALQVTKDKHKGRENQVENLLSGDPITCKIHRLASTPLPPRATATINVHILSRQVHAVNGTLPRRQQVNGHPWPPTPTHQQQVLFHFRTKPTHHLNKPHIQTTHSTQPTHTGLTTAATTTTHMIRMDPKARNPDVQLKHKSEGVQVRRHRPRRYNTSTGTKPRANSLAHKEPGAPNWRGNHGRRHTTCHVHKTTCMSHTNHVKPH